MFTGSKGVKGTLDSFNQKLRRKLISIKNAFSAYNIG
jgi:hypothetical protein